MRGVPYIPRIHLAVPVAGGTDPGSRMHWTAVSEMRLMAAPPRKTQR